MTSPSYLITGGTGSFGKAFAKMLLRIDGSDRICIYSRGEHAQAQMRAEFGDDPRLRWFIGDVRDRDRLRRAMQGVDIVIHAAALKRIETGYYNPIEMVRTNIDGAVNVIEAAQDASVKKVVALSTDKAVSPLSAYGHSKAMAESLFIAADRTSGRRGPRFAVTRYGNVWASAGSVVPTWRAMVEAGHRIVPVSDPDATRFWMSLDQAVILVMHTLAHMKGGELSVPEDLPAYRLGDLAEAMGVLMDVKGLGTYEKLHEEMTHGESSADARRMTVDEIRDALDMIGFKPAQPAEAA